MTPEDLLGLYAAMLRIRRFERRIEEVYHEDEMKTPIHLCIGQEAVAVGVCSALRREDAVQSNHRGHGHYLAKGGDLRALMAELFCRGSGCAGGRGGSMHLVDTAIGHHGSSSIVGGGIPIAVGLALAAAMRREERVSVVFFGDGAADEGVLYESVNFAMLRSLPVIFILENNEWSVCSHVSTRQAGPNVFLSLPPERLPTAVVDGNDVLAVRAAAGAATARARCGDGPSFIECKTYRIRGHAGAFSDAKLGYRGEAEIEAWERRCPIARFACHLRELGVLTEERRTRIEGDIEREIDEAFAAARAAPLPAAGELSRYLFSE